MGAVNDSFSKAMQQTMEKLANRSTSQVLSNTDTMLA
jgi:hypothetical protein